MKIKVQTTDFSAESHFSSRYQEYYLVSSKWSLKNEAFITFVRKEAFAYCYNLSWAGPISWFDAEKRVKKDCTVIVHLSTIQPFLIKVQNDDSECYMLPNNEEVRKVIGLQFAS